MRRMLEISGIAGLFAALALGCGQQPGGNADVKPAKNTAEPKCPFCDEGEKPPVAGDSKLVSTDAEPGAKAAGDSADPTKKTAGDTTSKSADAKPQAPGSTTQNSGSKTQDSGSKTPDSAAKLAEWPAPADREALALDFNFTDQDAKPFNLKAIKGKPTVATFIFTRCANPQMCPLQAMKMAELQKQLDKAGLSDQVNLLLITFDPDYDTPARLKEFAERNGVKFTNARTLRPDPRDFQEFRFEFRFRMGYSDKGEINHKTDLFVLDHQGRLTRPYAGMWEDGQVFEDVKKLITEMKPAAGKE